MTKPDTDRMSLDERLTAFIDGELDGEAAAAVEALIDSDPAVAERFDQLGRADLAYAEAFEPLLAEAPLARLEAMVAAVPAQTDRNPLPTSRRGFLAAAAACVIAGIAADRAFIGIDRWLKRPDEADAWRAVVAAYIELYTPDTLSTSSGDRAAQTAQLDLVGSKIGLALSPEAIALPGVDFRRAQVLDYDEQPLAQLAYLDPTTGPMALCIVKSSGGTAGPQTERRRGMNVVYWSTEVHAFMLIGHVGSDRLRSLAEDVRAKIPA